MFNSCEPPFNTVTPFGSLLFAPLTTAHVYWQVIVAYNVKYLIYKDKQDHSQPSQMSRGGQKEIIGTYDVKDIVTSRNWWRAGNILGRILSLVGSSLTMSPWTTVSYLCKWLIYLQLSTFASSHSFLSKASNMSSDLQANNSHRFFRWQQTFLESLEVTLSPWSITKQHIAESNLAMLVLCEVNGTCKYHSWYLPVTHTCDVICITISTVW